MFGILKFFRKVLDYVRVSFLKILGFFISGIEIFENRWYGEFVLGGIGYIFD